MKKQFLLMAILGCLAMALGFSACSKDDDEPAGSVKSEFVGNWFEESIDGEGYLVVLKSNGKYTAYEYANIPNGTYEDTWWGKWTYDSEKNMIIFYYKDTKDIEEGFEVLSVTNDRLEVRMYGYDDGEFGHSQNGTFVRISDSEVPTKYIR